MQNTYFCTNIVDALEIFQAPGLTKKNAIISIPDENIKNRKITFLWAKLRRNHIVLYPNEDSIFAISPQKTFPKIIPLQIRGFKQSDGSVDWIADYEYMAASHSIEKTSRAYLSSI